MSEVMTWLNNGLAVIIVVAIGFAIWRSSSVLFTHILMPMKDAGVNHLNGINEYMKSTAKALDNTAEALQNINSEVKSIRVDIDNIRQDVENKLKGPKNG